jgi:spore coat polysaccharide biosynthesis protein SpsF
VYKTCCNIGLSEASVKSRVVMIIQARMGSVRLPGKSLMDLAGEPLVGRVLERVLRCNNIDDIVLAIPKTIENDPLASLAKQYGVNLYRGSENDLVDRYYQAAKIFNATIVGRLPADNPIPEPNEIDRIIEYHIQSDCEFSSNLSEIYGNKYPDGLGAEMIDFTALKTVWEECKDSEKREHVHMNFFDYNNQKQVDERFSIGTIECPIFFRRPEIILDINTQEQYEFIKQIYEYFYNANPHFHIIDILDWYDEIYLKNINNLSE